MTQVWVGECFLCSQWGKTSAGYCVLSLQTKMSLQLGFAGSCRGSTLWTLSLYLKPCINREKNTNNNLFLFFSKPVSTDVTFTLPVPNHWHCLCFRGVPALLGNGCQSFSVSHTALLGGQKGFLFSQKHTMCTGLQEDCGLVGQACLLTAVARARQNCSVAESEHPTPQQSSSSFPAPSSLPL